MIIKKQKIYVHFGLDGLSVSGWYELDKVPALLKHFKSCLKASQRPRCFDKAKRPPR